MTSPTNPPPEVLHAGHETRDVNIRALLWLAIGTIAGVILVSAGLWLLLRQYQATAKRSEPPVSPLAGKKFDPPGPRLQNTPILDYENFRNQQEQGLTTYAWIDKEKGVVRIPVSRAMDLILERGLPMPEAAEPQSGAPENDAPQQDSSLPSSREAESSPR